MSSPPPAPEAPAAMSCFARCRALRRTRREDQPAEPPFRFQCPVRLQGGAIDNLFGSLCQEGCGGLQAQPRRSALPAARGSPSGGRLREGFMLRRLYDWTMAKASHPHAEWWLAFISFIESSFFPIPPHPLLGLMCLAEPQRAIRFAVICTLASV